MKKNNRRRIEKIFFTQMLVTQGVMILKCHLEGDQNQKWQRAQTCHFNRQALHRTRAERDRERYIYKERVGQTEREAEGATERETERGTERHRSDTEKQNVFLFHE